MLKTITVTQQHIDDGVVAICRECPLALAIREHTKKSVDVKVYCNSVGFEPNPPAVALLPRTARLFRFAFDAMARRHCKPFSFALNIPDRYIKEAPIERGDDSAVGSAD